LVVKALSAFGSWRTDLVVSTPMARLIRAMMRVGEAVDNCRMVIILDPAAGLTGGPTGGADDAQNQIEQAGAQSAGEQ
jgi:hypothetical protein